MAFPEKNILVGHEPLDFIGLNFAVKERRRFITSVAQLHGRISGEGLHEGQATAWIAYDQCFARPGHGRRGKQSLAREEQGQHAEIVVKQSSRGKTEWFRTGWCERLHLNRFVPAARRIRPAFHGHGLETGHERVYLRKQGVVQSGVHNRGGIRAGLVRQGQGRPLLRG